MITITSSGKESLVESVRRALKNADCNNKIVTLVRNGIATLVYPHDDIKSVLKCFKVQEITQKLSLLGVAV